MNRFRRRGGSGDDLVEPPRVDDLGRPLNEAAVELQASGEDPLEPTELERLTAWLDERTGLAGIVRTTLRKVFPDHWSFLLGEVALFCFVILVLTGTFLTFFYVPSAGLVEYTGSYPPLQGAEVSQAFNSVLYLSFEVRAGLLFRQIHTGPRSCSSRSSLRISPGCSSPAGSGARVRSTG